MANKKIVVLWLLLALALLMNGCSIGGKYGGDGQPYGFIDFKRERPDVDVYLESTETTESDYHNNRLKLNDGKNPIGRGTYQAFAYCNNIPKDTANLSINDGTIYLLSVNSDCHLKK